jgi:DNA-binding NarL/FixJ family response regulator
MAVRRPAERLLRPNGGSGSHPSSTMPLQATSSLLIVEPAKLIRESLLILLKDRAPDFKLQAVSAMTAVATRRVQMPAAVMVFTKMQEVDDPQLQMGSAHLERIWPRVPRLMISERTDKARVARQAVRSGWHGFFPAALEVDLLIAAVRLVIARGLFLPPSVIEEWAHDQVGHDGEADPRRFSP